MVIVFVVVVAAVVVGGGGGGITASWLENNIHLIPVMTVLGLWVSAV